MKREKWIESNRMWRWFIVKLKLPRPDPIQFVGRHDGCDRRVDPPRIRAGAGWNAPLAPVGKRLQSISIKSIKSGSHWVEKRILQLWFGALLLFLCWVFFSCFPSCFMFLFGKFGSVSLVNCRRNLARHQQLIFQSAWSFTWRIPTPGSSSSHWNSSSHSLVKSAGSTHGITDSGLRKSQHDLLSNAD